MLNFLRNFFQMIRELGRFLPGYIAWIFSSQKEKKFTVIEAEVYDVPVSSYPYLRSQVEKAFPNLTEEERVHIVLFTRSYVLDSLHDSYLAAELFAKDQPKE